MDNTVAIVAITSGATVLAAGITATASQLGLRRQLTAEDRRLRQRLRHELVGRDVDELRTTLDDAAQVLRRVRVQVANPADPGWVADGLEALEPLHARLAVRLGSQHEACHAVSMALDSMRDITALYRDVMPFETEEQEDAFWEELGRFRDEVIYQEREFLRAATETAGARLAIAGAEPGRD